MHGQQHIKICKDCAGDELILHLNWNWSVWERIRVFTLVQTLVVITGCVRLHLRLCFKLKRNIHSTASFVLYNQVLNKAKW